MEQIENKNVFYDSAKLLAFARDMRPRMDGKLQYELEIAMGSYGLDKGYEIIQVFKRLFKDEFLKQFLHASN